MTEPRETGPAEPVKPSRGPLDEGKTKIHELKRSGLSTKDLVASAIGIVVGVAVVMFFLSGPDQPESDRAVTRTSGDARKALCDLYIRRDKKASFRYQREEYLLSEIRDGNRSRIDFGTLVNQLAKDTWDSVRLVGEVGVGKSTMVKRVAARICLDTSVLVLRVNLDELPLLGEPTSADALQIIAEHVDLPIATIRRLRQQRLVLLLDGIDRLPYERHAAAAAVIKAFVKPAVDARLVLVSKRAINFYRVLDQAQWRVYELPPLTLKESNAYLRTKMNDDASFETFQTWLGEVELDQTFEQPGLGTSSAVYLSTYDDAKTVWNIFQEQPRAIETSWSIADLYHRFVLRSVKARDGQLPTLAKVQSWLDDSTPLPGPDAASEKKRMKWTTTRCEVAATKHGLPNPPAHCEQLFARAKGGLQFSKCANEEGCWTLYYGPHDDLFRSRRLARKVAELRSCERVREDLEQSVRERAAMLVGQPQVRQLCLPLLLESLCQSMGSPEPVAQHIRKGFPRGAQVRVEELGRFENEPSLSGCARQVIKRLIE
jgi:hypothetical protein